MSCVSLSLRWENALERNAETECQKGLHIKMSLTAPGAENRSGIERDEATGRMVNRRRISENIIRRAVHRGIRILARKHVNVRRKFCNGERMRLLAALFSARERRSHVD